MMRLFFVLIFSVLTVSSLYAQALQVVAAPGNTSVPLNGGSAYVQLTLEGLQQQGAARPDVNIAFVIDRSGSMAGEKLQYAKKAAINGVTMLDGQNDYAALIMYDDRVETLQKSKRVNKDALIALINSISEDGSTNLHGGMMRGIEEALKNLSKRNVTRVLLLSDGLANEGETDPEKIAKDAAKAFEKGVTITTLGMGADYNENLMVDIAKKGHGNYYFIESPKQITRIFEKEFSSILSVVAKDIQIEIIPPAGVPLRRAIGYDLQGEKVEANNVWSGSSSSFLFEFAMPKGDEGKSAKIVDFKITYLDPATGKKSEILKSVTVKYSAGSADPLSDKKVFTQFIELTQAEQLEKITQNLDKGDNKKATEIAEQEIKRLKEANKRLKSSKLSEDIAELEKKNDDIKSLGSRSYKESEEGKIMKKSMQQKSFDKMSK